GQDQRVELLDLRVRHPAVDLELVGGLVVVHALDLAVLDRQQAGGCTGLLDRFPGLGQLDLLDAIGGEDGNGLVLKGTAHGSSCESDAATCRSPQDAPGWMGAT